MALSSSLYARPLTLPRSTESQIYGLLALAMGLTVFGVYVGVRFAPVILTGGYHLFFLIAELVIIFTAGWWSKSSPLNYLLFAAFPILSGITFTPYAMVLLAGYANGASILMNALSATVCVSLAAAIFSRTTSWNLSAFGRAFLFVLFGLLALSILQIFVPSLRTGQFELLLSGAGIVLFAGFLAMDLQRVQSLGRQGANPFLLALSLYLDIYNLFLFILRFMVALSGRER